MVHTEAVLLPNVNVDRSLMAPPAVSSESVDREMCEDIVTTLLAVSSKDSTYSLYI